MTGEMVAPGRDANKALLIPPLKGEGPARKRRGQGHVAIETAPTRLRAARGATLPRKWGRDKNAKQNPAGRNRRGLLVRELKRKRLDRFLEVLGGAERALLRRLDLDRFAGGRVAPHAGGALARLQAAEAGGLHALALLQV